MPAQTNSRYAGGTINPCRFLQPDVTNTRYPELSCLQCSGAGVEIIGISQEWTKGMMGQRLAPAQGFPAAEAGDTVRVYGDGEEHMVFVGSGYIVVQDQLLTSDASGNAIPITIGATTQWIGARALEAGVAGDLIRVTVTLQAPYKVT